MANENGKKAVEYKEVEPVDRLAEIPQDRRVTSYVYDKDKLIRYTVVAEIPVIDPDPDTAFGCKLSHLVGMGIRQAIYGCEFKSLISPEKDEATTMADLQATVDAIDLKPKPKAERAKVTAETKQKAAEFDGIDAMAKEKGFTNAKEYIAYLQDQAAKKGKK